MTDPKPPPRLTEGAFPAVLMTCHQRRELTLRCLTSLFAQVDAPPFTVYLVDDGSTDGTAQSISELFPQVIVISGDGSLFWAGGMRKAWEVALEKGHDSYLWLNDDVQLDTDAFSRIYAAYRESDGMAVMGGAMRDPASGAVTYAGSVRYDRHPFHFRRVAPDPQAARTVDVLNGNLLLVPATVADRIGIMASYLIHHAGDYEYCVRASRAGFDVKLLPGTFGACAANPPGQKRRGLAGLRRALSKKHLPVEVGVPLYKNLAGRLWWFWLLKYYARCAAVGT